jgi:hypothetical protein
VGIISVQSPTTGSSYSVRIAGDVPTAEEQQRIDAYLAQQDAAFARTASQLFPSVSAPAPEAPVEEDDGTAIGRGFRSGIQNIRSLIGTTIEETGRAVGLEGVQEFGRGMETAAEEEFRKLREIRERTGLYDVEDVGSALTYGGETFGEQAPILAQTLAGTATGAGVGSFFGPVGTGVGAVVGGALASLPLLFGGNVQRQEEQVAAGELDEVNVQRALLTAIPQAALESIAAKVLAFTPLRGGTGNIWARAGKGGAAGVAAEVPTEITQQLLERAQAGLPIDSDDAIKEYIEAGVAAGILGGPIGAVGGVAQRDVAPQELDQDLKELAAEGAARFQFAEQTEREIEEARAKSLAAAGIDPDAPLGLDAPDVPLALPAPQDVDVAPETTIAEDEFANLSFDKAQYERVLQQVKADITSGKPINIPAIQQRVKSDIPGTKVSQVRDIMNELKARGFVAENPASKKNKFIAMGSLAPEVKTPDVSYRRQIDSAADFIKADQTRLERLQYDLRSAEAYGRDLEGNRVTPNQVNTTIARVEQRIAENQQRIEASNQRLQSLGQDTHVPRFEKVGLPPQMKAVPVAEGTVEALRPRFEAQQASIRGMKEQLNSINKQVRKLNDQAKKRTLSSNELDRMQKLQEQQAEVSTRLGEAQANLKTPEKIFQEAKGEQFREQERQREIERKLAAARARAAADQVKAQEDQGVSPVTPAFNAKQTRVFDALKKRLSNLGLKDVKLEGVQKIKGGEGFFDPVTKTITLAMGMYDPNMNDQQLFDAISEVMNHEVIHALRAMGVLKPNEMKVLERLAEKTKYVKRTKEGTQKRNYTYLDRAKSLYSDYTPTQQKEEAIAEMFRDYIAGRLKLGGGPRALFEKIKKFFKSLIGANVDEGFTRVEDIFQGIRRGEIGARDRVAPATQPAAAVAQPTDAAKADIPAANTGRKVDQGSARATETRAATRAALKLKSIPFDQYKRKPNSAELIPGTNVRGEAEIIDLGSRKMVMRDVNGVQVPFYLSSGLAGKKDVAAGKWYPFLGIGPDGWINKGSQQEINDYYGSPELRATAQELDSTIGDIRNDTSVPKVKPTGVHIDAINAGLNPTANSQADTRDAFDANLAALLDKINSGRTAAPSQVMLSRLPTLPMAPDGTKAHQLPSPLLMQGTGAAPVVRITQKYTPGNAAANNAAIQQILDQYPNAMLSESEWAEAMQASFGGDFIPVPPMVGLQYAQSPEKMAEKLRKLTPELKKGVDKGFEYVSQIRDIYNSGQASPRMTLDLFVWGILSRGAGPVQQEGAFIDIIDNAYPILEKATRQPLTEDDIDMWMTTVSGSIPEGSPGKQVTMNVNAAARLVRAMSQLMPGSNQTVLGAVHDAMSDPNESAANIRQLFMSNTQGAGIDNKVLSFILLVGGKDDVLVMDRIQGRHLWDDGRFGGANIYDGIGKQKEGLNGIFRGPPGILTTRILENGLRQNVNRAYELIGRPEDASLGRFHWETWVIEGEQVVSHDTLAAVISGSPIGQSVTEGKTDTFSSGMTYRRGEVSSVVEYPLSNGGVVYMKPERFKEFTTALADDAKKAKSSTGVFKEGKFKVTSRADIPWFDRPEVDRGALDAMAREYENAKPDGSVLVRTEGTRDSQDASQRGNSDLDRRYAEGEVRPERDRSGATGRQTGKFAPLEGTPVVEGATGPDENLIAVAEQYASDNGIDLRRQAEFVTVDPARAKRIADAYEAMEHRPQDPDVQEAYENLIRQTRAQYDALVDAGYEFTFFDSETDPYNGNPWNAMRDLRANKRMAVYGTYDGYGTEGLTAGAVDDNPMLQDTGLQWKDQGGVDRPVTANDLFRAVHDAFGHGLEGAGFRARGEENAWQAHVRLFTGSAVPAITSETRGQNSWLNYGPFGERNRNAAVEDTVFAEQKTGIMPSWTWQEGRAEDAQAYDAPVDQEQNRTLYSRLYSTTAQLAPQVQQKKLDLTYARSADFLAKGLGIVLPKDRAQEAADTILRKFQDNMLPVGRMIQELQAKGLTVTDAMDTYLKEELYHGVVGNEITRREETIYKNALDSVKGFNITSGMMDGLQSVSDAASPGRDGFVKQARESARSEKLALAEAYLYAKHAKERNAYIRTIDPDNNSGSGMTDAEADAILRWFTGLDAGNAAAVRALDAAAREIVADTNRVRVDSGLIPSEFDQVLDADGDVIERPSYDFYVPLRGMFDPEAAESDGNTARVGGQRFGGKGRADPRALGRYKYATDVLATLINQNQQSVARGERNRVGQSFLELLRADPATTKAYAEILPRTPTRRALVGRRVREITDFNAAKDPNIFVVKEDGKDVYVELFDPNLGAALKGDNGVGAGALGYIVRSMGMVNRYLANINTSYNPEFFVTNFLRDLQTAGVNIQQFDGDGLTTQIVKDVRRALGGIKRSIRNKDDSSEWSQIYKDFVNAGGQNVTNQMSTVADQMENIRGLVGDIADQGARGQWNRVKNSFVGKSAGSLLSFVEDYNTVIENGIRVATYKALLDRGFTRERAAQAARNVTVNFAKGGEYKNFMNAFYLFYNASLQGSFAMLNAALRSRKVQRIWAGVIAAGLLQDQLNALLSDEDEDGMKQYDKIPDYILHHNLILPDPFGFTDRSYIAIPMPYGLNMAHNIGRATSRALRGEYDAGEATSSIVGTIVDTINPLGGTENFANFVAPTVADPFIDVMQNEDFAGKPIFKEAFPGDRSPESQRYWSTTNPSAIWVAQNINSLTGGTSAIPGFIDLSPDVLNFWLEFATGGVGRFVQRTAELPVRVFDEGLDEEIYREVPFVRKIIGSVSTREDYGRYIEKRNEILLAGAEIKEAIDNRDRERALAARERFAEELRYLPRVRAIDNAIRQVNQQMNRVRDNRTMSDEQKRAIMDRLDERKQMLISRGNEILSEY